MPFFICKSKSEIKMSSLLHCFVVLVVLGSTIAFPGEFVPKSFYTIDENGQKSDVIYLRKNFVPRFRRSAPGGSFKAEGGVAFDGSSDAAAAVQTGLGDTFQRLRSLADEVASHGSGGGSFSGSFSSGGVSGAGVAGEGPVLHARFAEGERELVTGGAGHVHASASASGPNGGVSFSSSSVDSNGNVHYNTQAHRF